MSRFENALSKWNFKKIAICYIVIALIVGISCAGAVGYIYRDRLSFAWRYSQLKESAKDGDVNAAADRVANASSDVVDVLVLDGENQVIHSAKSSEFADGSLLLEKIGDTKEYLASSDHPESVFRYVKSEEFMFNSILNKDFGKISSDYDDDSEFESALSAKNVYMLNRIGVRGSESKIYVITTPTSVPYGMMALKLTAALAMLFFCIYWVLIALWMYKDAAKCRLSPLYWGLIGLFTNIIGLIVYKIYKRSMAVCPDCKAAQSAEHVYCSFCGTKLGRCCKACGGRIGARDLFCFHCGGKIE